jgi:uncharacterized Zn finger protein (UPF0148 family)
VAAKEGSQTMSEESSKAVNCPNCQGPAIRTGNEITCETCDATFVITKKQGAKVKTLGIDQRLKNLEDAVFVEETPEPVEPVEPVEPESEGGEI